MTIDRVIELLNIELQCVSLANNCNRDCANCYLVQDQSELEEMYKIAIDILSVKKKKSLFNRT